jgi:hypothetical protein
MPGNLYFGPTVCGKNLVFCFIWQQNNDFGKKPEVILPKTSFLATVLVLKNKVFKMKVFDIKNFVFKNKQCAETRTPFKCNIINFL